MITDAQWRERDLDVLWHPCTQMAEHPDLMPLITVASGRGAYLQDHAGTSYLDAVSSWWVNLFGHSEPRIAEAVGQQAHQLAHVILAGASHEPAVRLAERLLAVAPREAGREPLRKVFYADNGSAGVEVALKMAFHWFRNRGETQRTRFISLHNGYHGETLGALAVGDVPLYRKVYAPLLADPMFVRSPDAFNAQGLTAEQCVQQALQDLRDTLQRHQGEVCALILEPLIQCAGGMRMHDPSYLRGARALCDEFNVFLIADEIAVGFGRTGTLFACEQASIQPDFMCVSKGLTGGTLPLAAVLTTDSVYRGFLDTSRERAFLHSHSYTGNPLACVAALTTLDILEQDDVLNGNRERIQWMRDASQSMSGHGIVSDVRQTGMVVGFELNPDGDRTAAWENASRIGLRAYRYALEHGVLLRPLGNVLYWMPPYCVTEADVAKLADVTQGAIAEIAQHGEWNG